MMMTPEDARLVAREYWDINGFATILDSEWGGTFSLSTESGIACILKVAPTHIDKLRIELEAAAIGHLADSNPDVLVPRLIKGLSGKAIEETQFGATRIYTWIEGRMWSDVNPHPRGLLYSLGQKLGILKQGLAGFDHPGAHHNFRWSPHQADLMEDHLHLVEDPFFGINKTIIARIRDRQAFYSGLPMAVNYNDANDQNIICNGDFLNPEVVGFIDFGDLHYGPAVNDLAICLAYAIMGQRDPMAAATEVIMGYTSTYTLTEPELEALHELICARLAISITMAAKRAADDPNNTYWQISARSAQHLLIQLEKIPSHLALCTYRSAAGYEPCPKSSAVVEWLRSNASGMYPVLGEELAKSNKAVFDWSVGSTQLGTPEDIGDVETSTFEVFRDLNRQGASVGIGRYNEPRVVYTTKEFMVPGFHTDEGRTIHIGLDLFVPAGTPLYAPLDGIVHTVANNDRPKEYGPMLILQHDVGPEITFYTLYGHNSKSSLALLKKGDKVTQGQLIAYVGDHHENGNWVPHLHFQVMTDTLAYINDFPGVAAPSKREIWLSICPDPNLILQMGHPSLNVTTPDPDQLYHRRKSLLGTNLSVSHKTPLHIVRGWQTQLYDADGRAYLDTRNNIAHCGHEHPRIVKAGQRQMAVLNTNTRYLHELRLNLADELLKTLPDNLQRIYFVNSGSEANDLALRMAYHFTGVQTTVVMDQGYHGHTGLSLDVSHYKFSGSGGFTAKPNIRVLPPVSDGSEPALQELKVHTPNGPLTFIHEALPSCAGQIFPPVDYFTGIYKHVKEAGGLCIADEIQTGLGRTGSHFWAFERFGLAPDIVTIGKPMGNGHPVAAVAVTREVADAFDTGMEFFSSFGGNPVSCAIALEVLHVIREEKMIEHARVTGDYLLEHLQRIAERYPSVIAVRGSGFYIGLEIDPDMKCRGMAISTYIENRMIDHQILTSFDGPQRNVMKIKPPMTFSQNEAERFILTLEKILAEDAVAKIT